jgi:hypothetical protein
MSPRAERSLGMGGLAAAEQMAALAGELWADGDRAMVDATGALRAWPGWQRTSEPLSIVTLHGAGGDFYDVVAFSPAMVRQPAGHALALIDRSGSTARAATLALHGSGAPAAQLCGRPMPVDASPDVLQAKGLMNNASITGVWRVEMTGATAWRYSLDNGSSWTAGLAAASTSWQTLSSGIQIRWTSLSGLVNGDGWTLQMGCARPQVVARLARGGTSDYPAVSAVGARLAISAAFDVLKVAHGGTVRDAGLPTPPWAPRPSADGDDLLDLGSTDADPVEWVSARSGVVVTRQTADPAPAEGSAYVAVHLPNAQRDVKGDLAYLDTTLTIPAGAKRIRLNLRVGGLTREKIGSGLFSLVLASGTGLSGTRHELKFTSRLGSTYWAYCDWPWSAWEFNVASIGLTMIGTLSARFMPSAGLDFYIDTISATGATTSELLSGSPEYRFAFAWLDSSTGRESAQSPASPAMVCAGAAVRLDLSGAVTGGAAGAVNVPPDGVDAVQLYVSNAEWGTDPRTGGLAWCRATPGSGIPISSLDTTGGALAYVLGDEITRNLLLASDNPRAPFYNTPMTHGGALATDGSLLVAGARPGLISTWTFANASHVITPGGTSPATLGQWMVGRELLREGDTAVYHIHALLDTNSDGVADALWIGTDYDGTNEEWDTPYQGTSGTSRATILADERAIVWSNATSERGVDAETSSPLNRLELMPTDDRIVSIGKCGEFLWICGENNTFIMRQNLGALADLPGDSGAAYSSPLHLPGIGCVARRSWVSRSDGSAIWLGPRGELWQGAQGSAQRHPAGARLAGWLSGRGLLTDNHALRQAWAAEVRLWGRSYYFLCWPTATGDVTLIEPSVTNLAGLGWSSQAEGGGYDFYQPSSSAVPWNNYLIAADSGLFPAPWALLGSGMVHAPNYDYSPMLAFDQGAMGDWLFASQADALAGAFQLPALVWQPGMGYSGSEIACERTKDGAQCATETFIESGSADYVASDGTRGGVGYVYEGVYFPRGFWGVGCHRVSFKSAMIVDDALIGPATVARFVCHPEYHADLLEDGQNASQLVRPGDTLVFQVYYETDGAAALPADLFSLHAKYYTETYGYDVLIGSLPELAANTWTRVEFTLPDPAVEAGATFYPIDEFYFNADDAAGIAAAFDGNNEITLRLANGRTESAGDVPDPLPDSEPFTFTPGRDCVGLPGSTSAAPGNFGNGVLVDLESGALFPARDCAWPVAAQAATGCAPPGINGGGVWIMDETLHVGLALEAALLAWGSSSTEFWRRITGADGNTRTLAVTPARLPLDAAGAGMMTGLMAAIIGPTGELALARITSHTADHVILDEWPARAPQAGDMLVLGALPASIEWPDVTARRPMTAWGWAAESLRDPLFSVTGDAVTSPGWVWWQQRTAAADSLRPGTSGALAGWPLTRLEAGTGLLRLTPLASRALAYRLTWINSQLGGVQLTKLRVTERTHDGEGGR